MRRLELFQQTRALDGAWIILRLDGRGFSKLTEAHFKKPFDPHFKEAMTLATIATAQDFNATLAYTQSDEISLLLHQDTQLFDRRVEKLTTLSASLASVTFALKTQLPVQFDGRIWLGASLEQVRQYFLWRQHDATRCALATVCYWTLRNEGLSASAANNQLHKSSVSQKNELLFARGVNFNDLPIWQRRGTVTSWRTFDKLGFNPITQQEVSSSRRELVTDEAIPFGDAFGDYILDHL